MKKVQTDVIVVGAGPSGLMAANQLSHYQIDYVCIEKEKNRSVFSKAMGIHARTLEMLDLLGITDSFIERGYPGHGAKLYMGEQKASLLALHQIESRFPYMLAIPQTETEEILENHLNNKGGAINRGEELIDVINNNESVVVTVVKDGEIIEYQGQYLLACDGAHSKVRERLGVEFIGDKEGKTFFLGDVETSTVDHSMITGFINERGAIVFFPYLNGTFRVVGLDLSIQGKRKKHDKLLLQELKQSIDYVANTSIEIDDAKWLTYFGTAHKQVKNYQYGRVFFVGDAAHIHNPLGGQGMNLGLQDATNICWKLSTVIKEHAETALLETYDQERRPIAKDILQQTSRLLRFISTKATVGKFRNYLTKGLLTSSRIQYHIANNLSHIKYHYDSTPINKRLADSRLKMNSLQAGDRIPDILFLYKEVPDRRLYHLLQEQSFLCFVYMEEQTGDVIRYANLLEEQISSKFGDLVQTFLVVKGGVPNMEGNQLPVIYDVYREFEQKLTLRNGHTMFIRPDAHVGFHTIEQDNEAILARMHKFLNKAPH
ncbi:2-polyprenyl-6-methoxyphenol hydroxylase [Gracilibacillus ureilyticus]|uniref:2-polyprenyl-6-methoxyphenol hydroxylase n=1 Tax=Gracilibacillus ureilyticus TaxID=531814 RepID=A0A1H9UYB6_9BACI|nr:FAD-dependent monooxygenase [Gracilibacillus ureilyticus]SES14475.1 2-polyprenyl-6-methoxyphenol hydroxylase [Gracilibacillus ureilyticus]